MPTLTNLAKADKEVTEAGSELTKALERAKLQTLTAPVSGTVQDLAVHTLGGIVTTAQQWHGLIHGTVRAIARDAVE